MICMAGIWEENQYQSPASIFSDVESIQGEYLPSVEEIKENSFALLCNRNKNGI